MRTDEEPIVVEETFNRPREAVWEAITDKEQMVRWYFEDIEDFRPEAGFENRFTVNVGDKDWPHVWKVTEVVPGERLSYEWRYEGYPGDSVVTWELSDQEGSTHLKLTHRMVEDFPDVPELSRESGLAGWRAFLQDRLKRYLEDRSRG